MIDQRAVIEPGAQLDERVHVGPFSIIGKDVQIGADTWIGPHVVIQGEAIIGRSNRIYQFTSIGEAPQHLGYKGEPTAVRIGDHNTVREYVTINRGTEQGGGATTIGDHNFIMAYVHIAHDCALGSNTIFANCASLAGHVHVGDFAILGGFTLVHQFCRVGGHSITGIGTICLQDIPPYMVAAGNRAIPHGINSKGLRRRGFSDLEIAELKKAYKILYRSNLPLHEAVVRLCNDPWQSDKVKVLAHFIQNSERGVIR